MLAWRKGGWVGIQDRRKEGKCSDGRIKAVCCFHMVLCIYVYFLHVALIRQKRYVTVCRIFRNNCLLCVVGALSIICHCSKLQEEVLNFFHSPNK